MEYSPKPLQPGQDGGQGAWWDEEVGRGAEDRSLVVGLEVTGASSLAEWAQTGVI